MAIGILASLKHFLFSKGHNKYSLSTRLDIAQAQKDEITRILENPRYNFQADREKTLGIFENLDIVFKNQNFKFTDANSEDKYHRSYQIFRDKFAEAMRTAGYDNARVQSENEFLKFSSMGFAHWVERLFFINNATEKSLREAIEFLLGMFCEIMASKNIEVKQDILDRVSRNLSK